VGPVAGPEQLGSIDLLSALRTPQCQERLRSTDQERRSKASDVVRGALRSPGAEA